ncbi:MAG TPA: hypothetical protein VFI91_07420 [Longimicrobiaceae bacterium]|nr:hypothetical protein [Longimicrobiaceae bacterium]
MRSAALALLLLVPSTIHAQIDDDIPILGLSTSTRALGLGGAFVLSAQDSDALFYNPAVLDDGGGMAVAVQKIGTYGTAVSASAVTDWADGAIAVGVQTLDLYGSAVAASVGYARAFGGEEGFRLGIAGKFVEQRYDGSHDGAPALDIGAAKEIGPVVVGLAVRNLGPALELDGREISMPERITLGASTEREEVGPLDLLGTAAVSRLHDGTVIPAAGLEVSWWPIVGRTFSGRIGVRRVTMDDASPVTFGAGFSGDKLSIDYAFWSRGGLGDTHLIGLSWR